MNWCKQSAQYLCLAILVVVSGVAPADSYAATKKKPQKVTEFFNIPTEEGREITCAKVKSNWQLGKVKRGRFTSFKAMTGELKTKLRMQRTKKGKNKVKKQLNALKSDKELAQGICETGSLPTPAPTQTPVVVVPDVLPRLNRPLTTEDIRHLYRKAALGVVPDEAMNIGLSQGLDALIDYMFTSREEQAVIDEASTWLDEDPNAPINDVTQTGLHMYATRLLLRTTNPFHEALALLWLHDRFATNSSILDGGNNQRQLMVTHLELLRNAARTLDYKQLVKDIGVDPVMVKWLSLDQNSKNRPNENYARELMELFTLGTKDASGAENYTNQDIAQVAKAFTGWTVTRQSNQWVTIFVPTRFDSNPNKIIFDGTAHRGVVQTSTNVVDHILASHPSAPKFLAQWMTDNYLRPNAPADINAQLAHVLKTNDYKLRPAFDLLFKSAEFYDTRNYHTVIKVPAELTANVLRAAERRGMPYSFTNVRSSLTSTGQILTQPDTIFGWDREEEFVDAQRRIAQQNLFTSVSNNNSLFTQSNWNYTRFFDQAAPTPDQVLVSMEATFGITLTDAQRTAMRTYLGTAMNNQGAVITENWNPASTTMVRRKVAGLFRMFTSLPQMELK